MSTTEKKVPAGNGGPTKLDVPDVPDVLVPGVLDDDEVQTDSVSTTGTVAKEGVYDYAAGAPVSRSIFAEHAKKAYALYHVQIAFTGKLIGGTPKDAGLIEGWLRSKAGITDQQELRRAVIRTMVDEGYDLSTVLGGTDAEPASIPTEITDDLYASIKKTAEQVAGEQHTTGFKYDQNGLYLESRQVKAMLRENVSICFSDERWGPTRKGPKSFFAERVFVKPDKVYLNKKEADGLERFIGHVSDRNGKRSTLGYHEFAENVELEFDLEVLDNSIEDDKWIKVWLSSERNGLGALRSQSYGMFDVLAWERVR